MKTNSMLNTSERVMDEIIYSAKACLYSNETRACGALFALMKTMANKEKWEQEQEMKNITCAYGLLIWEFVMLVGCQSRLAYYLNNLYYTCELFNSNLGTLDVSHLCLPHALLLHVHPPHSQYIGGSYVFVWIVWKSLKIEIYWY